MSRRPKINRAIREYGANVTLKYKPPVNRPLVTTVLGVAMEDWPDPNLAPTLPPPPERMVKAIVVPEPDVEYMNISVEGQFPSEKVQAFFLATDDLSDVDLVEWQGNFYKIMQQKNYELQGEILAQAVLMIRQIAPVVMPHG